jgi:peptidoglycan/LPS O-acetylase OafA/YrhL
MTTRRFVSIDAFRGLAALVVVLSHTASDGSFLEFSSSPRWLGLSLDRALSFGRVGVTLFFIISGFCIHLRWARTVSQAQIPQIRFLPFWKQRFFRLYPPFLAALAIYLIAQTWNGSIRWDAFDFYNLISHLLLLHNFDERTIFNIDGVFWTLAIEEQLYLAYFVLLYLRSRWGWKRTISLCFGARVGWFALSFAVNKVGNGYRLPHEGGALANWFVWALGAIAIEAALGVIRLPDWTTRSRYALACFGLAIGCDLVSEFHLFGALGWRITWLMAAPIWGLGLFIVVNQVVAAEARWRAAKAIPGSVTFLAALGLFSYSTYLMHSFVLFYLDPALFRALGLPNSLANKLLFLPLCLALTWVFFACVERPFLRKSSDQPRARPIESRDLALNPTH